MICKELSGQVSRPSVIEAALFHKLAHGLFVVRPLLPRLNTTPSKCCELVDTNDPCFVQNLFNSRADGWTIEVVFVRAGIEHEILWLGLEVCNMVYRCAPVAFPHRWLVLKRELMGLMHLIWQPVSLRWFFSVSASVASIRMYTEVRSVVHDGGSRTHLSSFDYLL